MYSIIKTIVSNEIWNINLKNSTIISLIYISNFKGKKIYIYKYIYNIKLRKI